MDKTNVPYLTIGSIASALVALPMAQLASWLLQPGDDFLGYGSLGIAIKVLIVFFIIGFVLGSIGLYRGDKPRLLTICAVLINGGTLVWMLTILPI